MHDDDGATAAAADDDDDDEEEEEEEAEEEEEEDNDDDNEWMTGRVSHSRNEWRKGRRPLFGRWLGEPTLPAPLNTNVSRFHDARE